MDVDRIYEEHVRSLPLADQLRLAACIVAKVRANAEAIPMPPVVIMRPPDPADSAQWSAWLDASMHAAGERIRATMREMQARGILDAEGRLTPGELPEDMRPGSTATLASDWD
jgi:hypothetical protein